MAKPAYAKIARAHSALPVERGRMLKHMFLTSLCYLISFSLQALAANPVPHIDILNPASTAPLWRAKLSGFTNMDSEFPLRLMPC